MLLVYHRVNKTILERMVINRCVKLFHLGFQGVSLSCLVFYSKNVQYLLKVLRIVSQIVVCEVNSFKWVAVSKAFAKLEKFSLREGLESHARQVDMVQAICVRKKFSNILCKNHVKGWDGWLLYDRFLLFGYFWLLFCVSYNVCVNVIIT